MNFDIDDTVGAWVPHGRFMLAPTASGPLDGLRFAAKDVFDVAGHATGAGNPAWLATHPVAQQHAPLVAQLLAAGATLAGKVLTDELAFSLQGDNAHYGTPINATAPDRVPGGSSSGSCAAVAAHLVDFALATDTGGSTRVPASYAGLWGLRTTHGALSTQGVVPLHPSYDTPTWLAHAGETFERVGRVLLPESSFAPRRVLQVQDAWTTADEVFQAPLRQVADALAQLLDAPLAITPLAEGESLDHWRQVYMTAGAYEGWQVHGEWIEQAQPNFGAAIAARWRAASQVSAPAAQQARERAAQIRTSVRASIGTDGVAVLPSAASLAPLRAVDPASVDMVRMRTMSITCIAGLAGLPQVSLPLRAASGDWLGISLMGPAGSDLALIRLARRIKDQLE